MGTIVAGQWGLDCAMAGLQDRLLTTVDAVPDQGLKEHGGATIFDPHYAVAIRLSSYPATAHLLRSTVFKRTLGINSEALFSCPTKGSSTSAGTTRSRTPLHLDEGQGIGRLAEPPS
jgi:hypothetical protein